MQKGNVRLWNPWFVLALSVPFTFGWGLYLLALNSRELCEKNASRDRLIASAAIGITILGIVYLTMGGRSVTLLSGIVAVQAIVAIYSLIQGVRQASSIKEHFGPSIRSASWVVPALAGCLVMLGNGVAMRAAGLSAEDPNRVIPFDEVDWSKVQPAPAN